MSFEIHQLEAFDPTGRMFNRDVGITVDESGYTGHFSYEGFTLQTAAHPSVEAVIGDIVPKLQRKGFRDIRTRINFREERYLSERERWVSYKT